MQKTQLKPNVMKAGNIEILDLDFEYKLWKNKIAFSKSEIELLQDRVHVLSRENPGWMPDEKHMLLFTVQLEAIKSIEKQIHTQEQEIAFYAEDYPINTGHTHYIIHENIRKEVAKINFRQNEIINDIYPLLCYPLSQEEIVNN